VLSMTANAGFLPGIVISGLTFTGGDATAGIHPANCGGGIFLGINNDPLLSNVVISGNFAGSGGGLCADNGSDVRMINSLVMSNTAAAGDGGGGMRIIETTGITGSLFQGNQCLGSNCKGGGLLTFFNPVTLTATGFLSNTSDGHGGGAYAYGPVMLVGGLFTHNQCANLFGCDGGALYAGDTLNVTGADFVGNAAHLRGGAVRVDLAAVLVDALFQDNACSQSSLDLCWGGGLYSVGSVTLSGTIFVSNTALSRGGGVFADGQATLHGGLLFNNVCTQTGCHGGGMLADGPLAMTGTQVISNVATGSGGGIYAVVGVTLTNGLLQSNVCTEAGCQGGGYFGNGALMLTGTQIIGNAAPGGGGGAANVGAAALTNGLFQNNSCAGSGCWGGGLLAGTSLNLTGTTFMSNTAQRRGGGAYANNAAVLAGGQFMGNQCAAADCEGGGLYASSSLALAETDFVSNTARLYGGGIYAGGAAALSGGVFQGNTCTQADCMGGGLYVFPNNALTLTSMTFLSNTALAQGGGVNAEAAVGASGGLFRGNACTQDGCLGGGLYANGALTLTGTDVLSNSSRSSGAGVAALGGAALTNGLFQGNACSQSVCQGGGLYAGGALALTLTDTDFLSNTTRSNGGGALATASVTMIGGRFQGNSCAVAPCRGGGLFVTNGLTLTSAEIISNSAHSDGGGIYAGGPVVISGARFERNTCIADNCQGGGIHALNDLGLTATEFYSNTARFSGGGAYGNAGAQTVVVGGLFQGNACTQTGCRGGGLNVNGSLALTGTRFIANQAVFDGGGLRTAGPATVDTGVFQGNSAVQGGGFYHAGGAGRVVNTLFANNTAAHSGAALYVNGSGGAFNLLHDTIGMAATNNITSAVQVAAGSVGVTNTIFVFHDFGIVRTGGAVYEDYNLYAQVGFTTTGVTRGGHSLSGEAGFVNPAAGNFRLTIDSDAWDKGANAGVNVDFEGQLRPSGSGYDIGYDEAPPFVVPPPPPPPPAVFKLYLPLVTGP
jgi:predicted outer membrane repeat protein